MPAPPPCTRLGRHCRELGLTLRIADLKDDGQTLQDAAATWLLGHTERVTMGRPYVRGRDLLVDATVHVPCKYLAIEESGPLSGRQEAAGGGRGRRDGRPRATCAAHGFRGPMPLSTRPAPEDRPVVQRNNGKFAVVYRGRQRLLDLPLKRAAQRVLPVLQSDNPCVGAPCRTADNKQGAACCRDLTIDVVLPKSDRRTEALLRARKSPYLCKVTREGPDKVECEIISACGYLEDDGISCTLHDRLLPNGRLAKPSICYEWPDLGPDDLGHTGCRLL